MNSFIQSLGFEFPKLLWQIVNLVILLTIIGLIVLFPIWVIKKIKLIDKNLEQINEKLNRRE